MTPPLHDESPDRVTLGAVPVGTDGCRFTVWAPLAREVAIHLLTPVDRVVPLIPQARGYFAGDIADVPPGAEYLVRLTTPRGVVERPDPASRSQPRGVLGPSQVMAHQVVRRVDDWRGIPLADYVLYELHIGTFTPAGTFDAAIDQLDRLVELGITAVEVMPIAQFPGTRNWGYDGAYPFAAQGSYGGVAGWRRFVAACHARGLAVVLDVVYNHLGPEGNFLADYGPYFTDRYHTSWGWAVNFDGPQCDEVRRYFIENALYWLGECHVDALRLDAVHAIFDETAYPFLRELADRVRGLALRTGRQMHLFAESHGNDPRLVRPAERGGHGLDSQWSDDLHHVVHALLTGERTGYYADFTAVSQLAKTWHDGFHFTGQYSGYRRRRHGQPADDLAGERFVVCSQNHDQIGNRRGGERLSVLVSFEQLKLAAGLVLLAPFVPLLFMGEEYGETAPFLYFIDHADPHLVEAVRKGRWRDYSHFGWQEKPPDPQAIETFRQCILRPEAAGEGRQRVLHDFYRHLLALRKSTPALAALDRTQREVFAEDERHFFACRRWTDVDEVVLHFNLGEAAVLTTHFLAGTGWRELLRSSDPRWQTADTTPPRDATTSPADELAPHSFALWQRGKS